MPKAVSAKAVVVDPYEPFWKKNELTFWKWDLSERIVQLAAFSADVLHVREDAGHDNTGAIVDRYCAVAGLRGVPWCLCYQMWLLIKSGVSEAKLPPKRSRGSTVAVAKWARKNGHAVDVKLAKRGDILIRVNADGATGHAGVFLGWAEKPGHVRSIEGNTNDEGSREGYEVCRKERPMGYWTLAVRIR